MNSTQEIIAAADGSALGNPGPAGWAWYIDDDHWGERGAGRTALTTWVSSRLSWICRGDRIAPGGEAARVLR